MPFGRRRRDERKAEAQAVAAARSAVANVVGCFISHPDDYDVRSCIAIRNDADGVNVLHLGWDDEHVRFAYLFDGDAGAVISEVTPVSELSAAKAVAESWIGPTCREVEFEALPGLYQHAYVEALVQDALGSGDDVPLPLDPLIYLWTIPSDSDLWVVRLFPSGMGETGPRIGEVSCVLMPRAAIEEMYRLRGW